MEGSNDIAEKINELLSDEESLGQLTKLAEMFMSGSGEGGSSPSPPSEEETPDIGNMLRLAELAGSAVKPDSRAELLLALKPHLSEERQKKVDKAVRLLRLLAVWDTARESGLLSDML